MDIKKLIALSKQVPLTISSKLSIYKELSRSLRQGEVDDVTFKLLLTNFYDLAVSNIEAGDGSICAVALEVLGFFVQKMQSFNETEMRHLVRKIVDCIVQKNEKEISRNGMWCIQKLANQSTAKLPVEVCKTLIIDVIPKFLSGTLVPSSSVCISIPDLLILIHGIKPALLESYLAVFLTQIFGFLTNNVALVRAAGLKFMKHFPAASSDILHTELKKVKRRTEFCDSLIDFLVKQQEDALDIWEFVIRSLGLKLSMSVDMLNALLRIPEKAFGSSNLTIREKAFSRWSALIEVFGADHAVLNHEKRLRLLLVPLQNAGKTEGIVEAQMTIWLKLLQELGRGSHNRYCLVVEPFFDLLLKEDRGVVHLYPNLLPKIVATWAEILKLLPPVEFRLRYKTFFAQAEELVKQGKDASNVLAVLHTMTEAAAKSSSPRKAASLYEPCLEKLWSLGLTALENIEVSGEVSDSPFLKLIRVCFVHRAGKLETLERVLKLALRGNPLDTLPELGTVLAEECSRPETVYCWTKAASLAFQYMEKDDLVEFDGTKTKDFLFSPFGFGFGANKLALNDVFLDTFEKLCRLHCCVSEKEVNGTLDGWLRNIKEPTNSFFQGHVFLHVALLTTLTLSSDALIQEVWQDSGLKWLRFIARELMAKESLPEADKWRRKFWTVVRLLIETKEVQKQDLDKLREALLPAVNHVDFSYENKTLDQLFTERLQRVNQEMKTRTKEVTSTNKRKSKLEGRKMEEDFVLIAPTPPKAPQVLTEHQKEVKRTRRSVIPAMYHDYSQSSLGCEDSQLLGLSLMSIDTAVDVQEAAVTSVAKEQVAAMGSRKRTLRSRRKTSAGNASPVEPTVVTNTQIFPPDENAHLTPDAPTTTVKSEPDTEFMAKPRSVKKGRKKINAPIERSPEPVKASPLPSVEQPNDLTPLNTSTISLSSESQNHESDGQANVSQVILHMSSTSLDLASPSLDDTTTEVLANPSDLKLPEAFQASCKSPVKTCSPSEPRETLTHVVEDRTRARLPSFSTETLNSSVSGSARTDPREPNGAITHCPKAASSENPSKSPIISVIKSPDSAPPVADSSSTKEKTDEETEKESTKPPNKKRALITVKKMPLEDWCRQATLLRTVLPIVTENEHAPIQTDGQTHGTVREEVSPGQSGQSANVTSSVDSELRAAVNQTETGEASARSGSLDASNNNLELADTAEDLSGGQEENEAGAVRIKVEVLDGGDVRIESHLARVPSENSAKTKIGRSELQSKLLESIVRQNEGKSFHKLVSAKSTRKASPSVTGFRGAKFLELAQAKKSLNSVRPALTETPSKKNRPVSTSYPTSPAQDRPTVGLVTPTGSPSGGILKRRLANGETPSPKSRKVSFADTEIREESLPSPYRKSRRSLTLGESATDDQLAMPLEDPTEKNAQYSSGGKEVENRVAVEAADSLGEANGKESVEGGVDTVITEANEENHVENNQDGRISKRRPVSESRVDVETQPTMEGPTIEGQAVVQCLSMEISSEPEVPAYERLIEGAKNGLISKETILAMIESMPMSNEERVDFLCFSMKRVLMQPH